MNKINRVITLIGAFLLFSVSFLSCEKDDTLKANFYISPSYKSVVQPEDTTINFIIFVKKGKWELTCDVDWVLPQRLSGSAGGDTIQLKVKANPYRENRVAGIVVSNPGQGNSNIPLSIQQKGIPDIIESIPNPIYADNLPDVEKIVIKSNIDWTISSFPSWLTLSAVVKDSVVGTLTYSSMIVSVFENPNVFFRSENIVLKGTVLDKTTDVVVYQDGYGTLATDSLALLSLYNSTNGGAWKTTWNLTKPLSQWHGVEVAEIVHGKNKRVRVVALALSSNNLVGELPDDIYDLTMLKLLWLDRNSLTGFLSEKLSQFTLMENFRMGDNSQLEGVITTKIGDLSNLNYFSLYNTKVSGEIPSSIGNLSQLKSLELNSNELTGGLPESLGLLEDITNLKLQDNYLEGVIPATFKNNIQWFYWDIRKNICPQKGVGFTNCTEE